MNNEKKDKFVLLRASSRIKQRLSTEERVLLTKMRREPICFVDNPIFYSPEKAERIMKPVDDFGTESQPIQRFVWAIADPIGVPEEVDIPKGVVMTQEQERKIFLQYNYCKFQWISHAGQLLDTVAAARRAIFWFEKVLALRDKIANANMPLVLAMVKRTRLSNVDFSELISEGNMALLRSIAKFDVARGFKFSTYACQAILKSFSRASLKQTRYNSRFPKEFEPDMERSDFLEKRRAYEDQDWIDQLREVLDGNSAELNEVEENVIRERFVIPKASNNGDTIFPKTLEELGAILGITKERVRQIQNKALLKISISMGIRENNNIAQADLAKFRVRQRRQKIAEEAEPEKNPQPEITAPAGWRKMIAKERRHYRKVWKVTEKERKPSQKPAKKKKQNKPKKRILSWDEKINRLLREANRLLKGY